MLFSCCDGYIKINFRLLAPPPLPLLPSLLYLITRLLDITRCDNFLTRRTSDLFDNSPSLQKFLSQREKEKKRKEKRARHVCSTARNE